MNPVLINKFLWIMQCFLAVTFLVAGLAKLFQSPAKVAQLVPLAFPLSFLRVLGALEIWGAIGIVLPLLIKVPPAVTPFISGCMVVVLVAAAVVHLKSGQLSKLPMLLVLVMLAILVTTGRSFIRD